MISIKELIKEKVDIYKAEIERTVYEKVEFILDSRADDMIQSAINLNVQYLEDEIDDGISQAIDSLVEDEIKTYIDYSLEEYVASELEDKVGEQVAYEIQSIVDEQF